MATTITKKIVFFAILIAAATTLQFCTSTKKSTKSEKINLVSYEKDLKPIMIRSCTPCHFPEKGRLEHLNTYQATKNYVNAIIERIELAPDAKGYMPYASKKPALSVTEINLFKEWIAQDMPK